MAFAWLYKHVGGYFRRRRQRWLVGQFADCRTIVDLGGTVESWSGVSFPQVVLVNREPPNGQPLPPGFTYIQADACESGLHKGFDLAFSNSVIEHLGTLERQRQFAGELLRLGRRLYCQTPNRWFPVEPHYLAVFVHWLPSSAFGHFLHRYFTLQGWAERPSPEISGAVRRRESIRLLTKSELREMFPGCHVRTERFLGFAKSFVVWR